jgi:predicted phage terminase large subunit-like protein
MQAIRYWDLAATKKDSQHADPDWTVGAKVGKNKSGNYFIMDIRRTRGSPQEVEALVRQTAQLDGSSVRIFMEQEPGASGKTLIDYYLRQVLGGFSFYADKVTGDKITRADPVSSQAEAGNIYLVKGPWITDFLDEAEAFPNGSHDDQVDAVSGAFNQLAKSGVAEIRWI